LVDDRDIDDDGAQSKLHKGFRKNIDYGVDGSDVPALD